MIPGRAWSVCVFFSKFLWWIQTWSIQNDAPDFSKCPKKYVVKKTAVGQGITKACNKRGCCATPVTLPHHETRNAVANRQAKRDDAMAKSKFNWWQSARNLIQEGHDHEWLMKKSTLVTTGSESCWDTPNSEFPVTASSKCQRTCDAEAALNSPCSRARATCPWIACIPVGARSQIA